MTMPRTTEGRGAAVRVADGINASAEPSHPCSAGVMPAFSMRECEVSVSQSSAGG
jgi:hypothetical protein